MNRLLLAVLASSLCICRLVAQATFVVDAASGPGSQFSSIQVAVDSVPSGSALVVRRGVYQPVAIFAKSITILCDPGVFVRHPLTSRQRYLSIQSTAGNQPVVVRGLVPSPASEHFALVRAAQGPVVIDGASADIGHIEVLSSARVSVRDARITTAPADAAAAIVHDSNVVFDGCMIEGAHGAEGRQPTDALQLGGSGNDCTLARSSALGGNGYFANGPAGPRSSLPGPAVRMTAGSALRILGDNTNSVVAGMPHLGQPASPSIAGQGAATACPLVDLGMLPVEAGIAFSTRSMPSLSTVSAAPGGALLTTRHGAVGTFSVLALAPLGPVPPTPSGLWLLPGSAIVRDASIVTAPAVVFATQVPNVAALRGLAVVFQSADLLGLGAVELSNASVAVIH